MKGCKYRNTFPYVYKIVSFERDILVARLSFKKKIQKWLKRTLDDPLVQLLSKETHLTHTQLETLLIDVLATNIADKPLKYQEKATLRLSEVTRGAFNRTLSQARKNTIRSIYTILLLGYLGVLEDTSLNPYLEISNKLRIYMQSYRQILQNKNAKDEQLRIMNKLRKELETSLQKLSEPKALSTET